MQERREKLRAFCADLPSQPFVWEIGAGHGHFLTAYAAAHPAEFCIGIDILLDRVERARRKQERARLANLRFLRAAADDFLAVLPPQARFSAVYLLFPDPWPKRRHHKYRVMDAELLTAIAQRAGEGAPLHFRTDYEPYYAEARAAVEAHPDWRLSAEPWAFEMPTVFQQKAALYHSLLARRR